MTRARAAALLVVLAVVLAATAAANALATCGTPTYTPVEGYGGGNPGAPALVPTCTGDPINCATGNLFLEQTDVLIDGRGPGLTATRGYNAQIAAKATEAGRFGYGWTGPYSARVEVDEKAATTTVRHDNGSGVVFRLDTGKYVAESWVQATLVKKEGNYVYTLPDQTVLTFNGSGRLSSEADRHGNSISFAYDESGRLKTATDAAGRTLTFAYNGEGQVKSITDPMEKVVEYGYESGNLKTVTLPGQEKPRWEFGYDKSHRLTSLTDGRGNTTTTEYDASNRAIQQIDALERKRTLEYKSISGGTETVITEPNGSKTVQKFNEAGLLTSVTYASGTALAATTTRKYDSSLNLTEVTDPNSHTTKYGYDAAGNRTSEKDPNGNETKWTYNSTRDLTSVTTPKGQTTTLVLNATGDPETIERPGPGETVQKYTFKYAKNGDLESGTDPLSRTTTFEYDTYGNLKAKTNPEGDKQTWAYNKNSYLVSKVSPRGNQEGAEASKFETKFERDAQGRVLTETDPLGNTTKYAYDGNGNVETVTDGNSRTTTYTYDKADQPTKVKAANGDVRETGYNSMGQVISRTDGNKNVRKYERNALGNVTEEIDPLERKTLKEYDAGGNLKKVTDPESRTISYTYDAGDRLEKVDFSEASTADVSYGYDKDGNVTSMTDGTGTTKYTFDVLDRLTEVENGAKELVKYEYNLADEQTKVTYPNGKAVTRAFDKAGRLESVTDWLENKTKFGYNRDSALTAITYPTATENKDEFEYDNLDQMTKVVMKKGASSLASVTYTRDKVGQVKTMTSTGLPGAAETEYTYDEKNRLTKSGATEFKYDAADNATSIAGTTYSYDKASQLEKGGGVSFSFDKLGNRTKATPEAGPATTYGYDQAGNLVSVNRTAEGEIKKIEDTYAYDGNGLRTSQTISGTKKSFAWDVSGDLPLLLSDGTNSYVYGAGDLPIAQIDAEGKVHYLHHDQIGSTRLLTNGSGEVKGAYSYKPYGAVEANTGTVKTPLGFNGQYTNESTGLIYLRARSYDPVTAQFMSVDPAVYETGEPYAYAEDNPLNRADPTGLCAQQDDAQKVCDRLEMEIAKYEAVFRSRNASATRLRETAERFEAEADDLEWWRFSYRAFLRRTARTKREESAKAAEEALEAAVTAIKLRTKLSEIKKCLRKGPK